MKNTILMISFMYVNLFYSQINLNIYKTSETISYPISEIDSSYFDLNNNLKKVVLIDGTTENHSIADIIYVNFSQPSFPTGTVYCNNIPTTIVDVINPVTGKTWMDRNLGASQAATTSNNFSAYGDLYQWGRFSDGHQCRNSPTTSTLSSSDQPEHGNFITTASNWRSPSNNNLWQGVDGVNNPCPSGYRLPTSFEFIAEIQSWSSNNSTGAFASPLKLPVAGYRDLGFGSLINVSAVGYYWTSTTSGSSFSTRMSFSSSGTTAFATARASGSSIRCIKN